MKSRKESPARDRILATAQRLFYSQGVRATGVNEIIDKADVSKATFFSHFPTKDDLTQAYLERMIGSELDFLGAELKKARTPMERFLAFIDSQEAWLRSVNIRGCSFLNMVSEIPDPSSPQRKKGKEFYQRLRDMIRSATRELVASERKYGRLDVDQVTDGYLVILVGGLGLSALYHDLWPIRRAAQAVRALVD